MEYKAHREHLQSLGICPFCKEREEFSIDQNEYAFALLARAPYHPDHILICPKRHGEVISDYSPEELANIDQLLHKWQNLLYQYHGEVVTFLRQGKTLGTTGKSIAHLHRHIIPHFRIDFGGSFEASEQRKVYTDLELKNEQTRIQRLLTVQK